ncbi:OB-fold nucleic acid binding domain-containing protein, partial [Chloroflexota bacterium]
MGVYLSEHPFSAFAGRAGSETTLCGQIDADLAGQTVIVAGMVASVRSLFTRDGHPFASAVLEDLDGRIEVMVWPKVYVDTKELWEEGNILLVEGKVRVRDDRVQLNCDSVQRYQPEAAQVEEAPPQLVEAQVATEEAAPAESRHLVISISQTSDKERDLSYLHKLVDTLKDFPGHDKVNLCVVNGEKVSNLRLANSYINYCPELHQRLAEMVGEDGL